MSFQKLRTFRNELEKFINFYFWYQNFIRLGAVSALWFTYFIRFENFAKIRGICENPEARGLKYRDSKKDLPENPGLGPRPGLKIKKYGSGSGTGTPNSKIRDPGLGPEPILMRRRIAETQLFGTVPETKKIETRSRGLKMFQDTVPVPWWPRVQDHLCPKIVCIFFTNFFKL